MLKEIPLIPFALVWSLLVYACNSTAPHSSETLPQVAATQAVEVSYGQGDNAMDVDLRNPGKAVKLTDYFSESDILSALLSDRVIKLAFAEARV